jgi:hypothetical protein
MKALTVEGGAAVGVAATDMAGAGEGSEVVWVVVFGTATGELAPRLTELEAVFVTPTPVSLVTPRKRPLVMTEEGLLGMGTFEKDGTGFVEVKARFSAATAWVALGEVSEAILPGYLWVAFELEWIDSPRLDSTATVVSRLARARILRADIANLLFVAPRRLAILTIETLNLRQTLFHT